MCETENVLGFSGFHAGLQKMQRQAKLLDSAEIWWAHQDSNLEPDRYERSALTIEL